MIVVWTNFGACGKTQPTLAARVGLRAANAATALTTSLYGDAVISNAAARACQKTVGKAAATELASFATALDGCLDKVNAGKLSGNSQATCLGAWAAPGAVPPTDTKTAARLDKAAAKAAAAIQSKCVAGALPSLPCGGGSAAGVAGCMRCAGFAQATGLVADTY